MAKKHEENSDLRAFARIGKIDYSTRSLTASKGSIIGNRTWGRIDFLTHYCGWRFYYMDGTTVVSSNDSNVILRKIKKDKQNTKYNKIRKNG